MILALVEVVRSTSNVTAANALDYIKYNPMILRLSIGVLFLFFGFQLEAQVTVSEEPEITNLMREYVSNNRQETIVRAWRIQILTTNDRRKMETGIKKFQTLYPDVDFTWEHNPPYYQVRIGAYELREDLEATLLELKRDFPSALPVQAEMKKTQLLELN